MPVGLVTVLAMRALNIISLVGQSRPMWAACAAVFGSAIAAASLGQTDEEVTIAIGKSNGNIRPLLGVNAGPRLLMRGGGELDLTDGYRRLGVRQVRTHDFYGPLDMSTMFPNLAADRTQTFSFRFDESDRFFDAIIKGGFEPYLRLGDSWMADDRYPRPRRRAPQDFERWARAAVTVVRHYEDRSEGRLRYAEIWNEPDLQQFWDAPRQVFLTYMHARHAR